VVASGAGAGAVIAGATAEGGIAEGGAYSGAEGEDVASFPVAGNVVGFLGGLDMVLRVKSNSDNE
jgi:hypothetical protein